MISLRTKLIIIEIITVILISTCEGKQRLDDLIVGGTDCSIEQHPYMVSIRRTMGLHHFCGGTLVTTKWVLTAAHCLKDFLHVPEFITVVAGVSRVDRGALQFSRAFSVYIHDDFELYELINDIGLIWLIRDLELSYTVQLVQLPKYETKGDLVPKPCAPSTIVGWGSQTAVKPQRADEDVRKSYKPILQCANISVISNSYCSSLQGHSVKDGFVCAMHEGGGVDTCQGDSGGPLLCDGAQNGITAGGYGCAWPNTPGFYTRVDKYLNFISTTIQNDAKLIDLNIHQILILLLINFISILAITLLILETVTARNNVSRLDPLIVGGSDCSIEKNPFMVSVRRTMGLQHFCGGSLISTQWVLSAGHCVEPYLQDAQLITVAAGLSRVDRSGTQWSKAAKLFIHVQYVKLNYGLDNDIGLIRLLRAVSLSYAVQIVQLPDAPVTNQPVHKICKRSMIIGWGEQNVKDVGKSSGTKKEYNPNLQCANIETISLHECSNKLGIEISPTHLCALHTAGGIDTCQGDSGGPLMCGNVQYGITSGGYGCGLPNMPGIYMRVDKYLDFIQQAVKNKSNQISYVTSILGITFVIFLT